MRPTRLGVRAAAQEGLGAHRPCRHVPGRRLERRESTTPARACGRRPVPCASRRRCRSSEVGPAEAGQGQQRAHQPSLEAANCIAAATGAARALTLASGGRPAEEGGELSAGLGEERARGPARLQHRKGNRASYNRAAAPQAAEVGQEMHQRKRARLFSPLLDGAYDLRAAPAPYED